MAQPVAVDDVLAACEQAVGRAVDYELHCQRIVRIEIPADSGKQRAVASRVSTRSVVRLMYEKGAHVWMPFEGLPDRATLRTLAHHLPARTSRERPEGIAFAGAAIRSNHSPPLVVGEQRTGADVAQHEERLDGAYRSADGFLERWSRRRHGLSPRGLPALFLPNLVWFGESPEVTRLLVQGEGLPRGVNGATGRPPASGAPLLLTPLVWSALAASVATSIVRGFAGMPTREACIHLLEPGPVPGTSTPLRDLDGVTPQSRLLHDRWGGQEALESSLGATYGHRDHTPTGHLRLLSWHGGPRPLPWQVQILPEATSAMPPEATSHVATGVRWLGTQTLRSSERISLSLVVAERTSRGLAAVPDTVDVTVTPRELLEHVEQVGAPAGWIDGEIGIAAQLLQWKLPV